MEQLMAGTASGGRVSAFLHESPVPEAGLPLLVTLHGGTYTSAYFSVAGSAAGSFVDIAGRNGFHALAVDRPGYGGSDLLPEAENTFARQAELLDAAIAELLPATPGREVVLVGHSIGGMTALEIAARRPAWPLIGAAVSGMGGRIRAGGPAEALGALPMEGVVDLPIPAREQLWYGPAGSVTEEAVLAARASFAPTPMVELTFAPTWATRRLAEVAAAVGVPVHHCLAEFDALWDSSPEARDLFLAAFDPALRVDSQIVAGAGHCLDHHLVGAAVHLRQLAFARDCALLAAREPAGTP